MHISSAYTLGVGTLTEMRSQVKLLEKYLFMHKGKGLFVSGCGKYKIQSAGKVKFYDARENN